MPDEDIEHGFVHAVSWIELEEDLSRYLLAGSDQANRLLELVVDVEGAGPVIHAMPPRRSSAQELFGGEQ